MSRTAPTILAIALLAAAAVGIAHLVSRHDFGSAAAMPREAVAAQASAELPGQVESTLPRELALDSAPASETILQEASRLPSLVVPPARGGKAFVYVHVVHADDQSPVFGAECRLTPAEWPHPHATSGGSQTTGSDGMCQFEVASDWEHWLNVLVPDQQVPQRKVAPLAAGAKDWSGSTDVYGRFYDGPRGEVRCQILARGLHVSHETLVRGVTVECAVPAEALEVVIRERGSGVDEKKAITATPGDTVDLVPGRGH